MTHRLCQRNSMSYYVQLHERHAAVLQLRLDSHGVELAIDNAHKDIEKASARLNSSQRVVDTLRGQVDKGEGACSGAS